MPISLTHVVEIEHQFVEEFKIQQLTTALIANQVRSVTKPVESTFFELYNILGSIAGRSNMDAKERAIAFGKAANVSVNAESYSYTIPAYALTVTLSGQVEQNFRFLTLEAAENAYVEVLTAASLSQEKLTSGV